MNLVTSYFFLAGLEILPIAPSAVGVVSRRDPKIGPATMGFSPAPFRRAFFARQETRKFSDNCRIFQYFRVLVSTNEHSQIVANGKSILVVGCFSSISFLLCCSRTWQKPMISDSNWWSQAEYSISTVYHHTGRWPLYLRSTPSK